MAGTPNGRFRQGNIVQERDQGKVSGRAELNSTRGSSRAEDDSSWKHTEQGWNSSAPCPLRPPRHKAGGWRGGMPLNPWAPCGQRHWLALGQLASKRGLLAPGEVAGGCDAPGAPQSLAAATGLHPHFLPPHIALCSVPSHRF